MRYLTLGEILELHHRLIELHGGSANIHSLEALEAAIFLDLNGYEIEASVDEQEQVILRLAAGELERDEFTNWLVARAVAKS